MSLVEAASVMRDLGFHPYIDFHADTLMMFSDGPEGPKEGPRAGLKPDLWDFPQGMVDIRRLAEGGCEAQFFSTFLPPENHMTQSDESYRSHLYDGLTDAVKKYPDKIAFAKSYEDLMSNKAKGLISLFLTFEDGRMVKSLDLLDQYYQLGYRLITLTWNHSNCLGNPSSDDPLDMEKGLTPLGKDVVQHMNELGMIVDVSHLSDGGFWDVADVSSKPFVASHSCCRALNPHRRNLTDPMLRRLAEKGGFIGINFFSYFCGRSVKDEYSRVEDICDHIEHAVNTAGIDSVGLGSDFDGFDSIRDVASPLDMHKIFEELEKRGWKWGQIEKIAHENAERVIKDILD